MLWVVGNIYTLFLTGLYYDAQEIIPFVQGDFRWDRVDNTVSKFNSETEVRALLEGQFLAKRAHAEDLGFVIGLLFLCIYGGCDIYSS